MDIQSNQLADLYAILDREERETALSNSDRRRLQWLRFQRHNLYVPGSLVVPIVVGLSWAIVELLEGRDFSNVLKVFVRMTLYFSPLTIAYYLLMFSLNWGQIFSTLKRERKVSKLGYGEMLKAPWRAERAKRPIINLLTLAAGPFMCSWGVFFIFIELFLAKLVPDATWTHPSWWVYLCSLYTIGLGIVCVILHLFRRANERLGVVKCLRDSLNTASEGRAQDGKGSVLIANEVHDRIAQIERKQIWQDRAASISKFEGHSDIAYVVQKGRSLRDAQSALDPATSLRVQDEIETLARGPTDLDTARGENPNVLWRSVPETSFEFAFFADRAERRIRILKLRKVNQQVPSSPEVDDS
jgi:hypothetical protein